MANNHLNKIYLHDFHKKNHAKFVPFAGHLMPINYRGGIINEHHHVRKLTGIFDVSHMGQIIISCNETNIINLEKFIPLDLKNIDVGQSFYSFILNNKGGIIDDIILSKLIHEKKEMFFIVYNSSRKTTDEKIFNTILSDYEIIKNRSLFALQGPYSKNILSKFFDINNSMFFMNIKTFEFNNEKLFISRTGYTGEDGFEISIPNSVSEEFISLLLKENETILCGLGCRDSLRIEAGLSLYGNELNEQITPVQAGLSWAISKKRIKLNNFNGSSNIISQINHNFTEKKVGLIAKSKSILRSNMEVFQSNINIGIITSGGFSPSLNCSIAIAYLKKNMINTSNIKYCLIRKNIEKVDIFDLPFIKHKYWRGKYE